MTINKNKRKAPESEAGLADAIVTLVEQFDWLITKLLVAGCIPKHPAELPREQIELCGAEDYAQRVYDTVYRVFEGSIRVLGHFEFCICQHHECLHRIAVGTNSPDGWYSCGYCGKPLHIEHRETKDEPRVSRPDMKPNLKIPNKMPQSFDCGASGWKPENDDPNR